MNKSAVLKQVSQLYQSIYKPFVSGFYLLSQIPTDLKLVQKSYDQVFLLHHWKRYFFLLFFNYYKIAIQATACEWESKTVMTLMQCDD